MYRDQHICAVLPARDEAQAIEGVVRELRQTALFDRIIVCDNGSRDDTGALAAAVGAEVVVEKRPGYGAACQAALAQIDATDIVVFVDADGSLRIGEAVQLIDAVIDGASLAIGTRIKSWREPGSMTLPQILGNRLASGLIRLIWQSRVTDLGPFRAVRFEALKRIDMRDQAFGWTVEMQVKAIQLGLDMIEIPVHYRRRIGHSKISGTLSGVVGAAMGIIGTIFRLALNAGPGRVPAKPVSIRRRSRTG